MTWSSPRHPGSSRLWSLLILTVTAAALPGCSTNGNNETGGGGDGGPRSGPCAPATCRGCCDEAGVCWPGTEPASCGVEGQACGACAIGAECHAGRCVAPEVMADGGSGAAAACPRAVTPMDPAVASTPGTERPQVLLVVDTSGSMDLPVDYSDPRCPSGCGLSKGALCPAACPTRWAQAQAALDGFVAGHGAELRLGLVTFPANQECGAPTAPRVTPPKGRDLEAKLEPAAAAVRAMLQGISSQGGPGNSTSGGTPTGAALRFVSDRRLAEEPGRENFVVLVTDGLPNCNDANRNSCSDAEACACTLPGGPSDCAGSYCRLGCLDADATEQEIEALAARGVRTLVVGIGQDITSSSAAAVLNRMARAGGAIRRCQPEQLNACGPSNTCDAQRGECVKQFFGGDTLGQVAAALEGPVLRELAAGPTCLHALEEDVPGSRLAPLLDGLPAGCEGRDWRRTDRWVHFLGEACLRVRAGAQVTFRRL